MKTPSLHDLYDPTSLIRLERSIAEGKIPNREELAAALEANSEQPLPPWFISTVIKSLRGELKKRPGRPKDNSSRRYGWRWRKKNISSIAWLQKRSALSGWKAGPRFAVNTGGLDRRMNARPELSRRAGLTT